MISHNEVLGIVYLNLIVLGILGNSFLLYLYSHKSITNHRRRPINIIVIHVAFSNSMLILFGGVPKIIQVWVLKSFLDCYEVKILNYFMRVARGLSLCSSCLLSVSQAIIISPYNSMWAGFKARVPQCTLPCCLLCWILNLLIAIFIPVYVTCQQNSSKERWNIWSSSLNLHAINTIKITIWKSVYDSVFVVLMAFTSGYMVSVLYRHHQRVQHIHRTNMVPRTSPETRATKAILLLMIFFVCFTFISSLFSVYMVYSENTKIWVINAMIILSLCYPAVSPFILIRSDSQIIWACHGH